MTVLVKNISAVMDNVDTATRTATASRGAVSNTGLDRTLLSILNVCGEVKTWKRVMHPLTNAPMRFGLASFERGADACEIAAACVDGLVVAGSRLKLRPNAFTKAVVDTNKKERAAASDAYRAGMRAFKRKQKQDQEEAQQQKKKEELEEQKTLVKKEENLKQDEEVKDDNDKVDATVDASAAAPVDASAAAPVDATPEGKATDGDGGGDNGGTKEEEQETFSHWIRTGDDASPPDTTVAVPDADAGVTATQDESGKDTGGNQVAMKEEEAKEDAEDPNDPMVAMSMAIRRARDVIKALVDEFHSAHPEAAAATQAFLQKEEGLEDQKEDTGADAVVAGKTGEEEKEGGGAPERANDVGSFLAGMRRRTMLDLSTTAEDVRTRAEHGASTHGRDEEHGTSGRKGDGEPASTASRPDVVVGSRDADRERERGGNLEKDNGWRHRDRNRDRDRDRDRRGEHGAHHSGRKMNSRERDWERRERDAAKQRAYVQARDEGDARERRRIIKRDEQVTSDDEFDVMYRLRKSVDKEDSRERRDRVARRKKREREKEEDSKLKRRRITAPKTQVSPAGESGALPHASPHDGDDQGGRAAAATTATRNETVKIGFGLGAGMAAAAPAAIVVVDDDGDGDDAGPRRPIIPIDYSVEELAAAHMPATATEDMDADTEVKPGVTTEAILKSLESSIPKTKAEVFATPVEWEHLLGDTHVVSTMSSVTKWLKKEIEEQFGEVDETMVEFIVESITGQCAPQDLLEEFEPVLESGAEDFVVGLWRLVILEGRKAKHGLM